MIRIACVGLLAVFVMVAAVIVVNWYDDTLAVGRMWQTPVIRPHEQPIPVMAAGSVPWSGGEALYRHADPDTLRPPFALNDAGIIAHGAIGYGYYCVHCHGPNYDGYGTVGQSFAPPPRDLRGDQVQSMTPGALFQEISYGIPDGRQPALASTMSADERWHVVAYVKSLGRRD